MTDEERKQTKPFAAWLAEHKQGGLHTELSEKLAELACAVTEHSKPGTLTLTISMKPQNGMLVITDTVKQNAPEADRGGSFFYADAEGNLSRNDPNQLELGPLRVIENSDGNLESLNTETGEVVELNS